MTIRSLLLGTLCLLASGCNITVLGIGTDTMDATVRFISVEGGCWAIDASDGTRYEPVGLPAAYRVDGLAVRVALRERRDLSSFCMIGKIAEVESIRRRD